jgi:hypothetical protein
MWTITKKKPISTTQLAHGVNEYASETEGIIGTARWITALACLSYGDTFASGTPPPSLVCLHRLTPVQDLGTVSFDFGRLTRKCDPSPP